MRKNFFSAIEKSLRRTTVKRARATRRIPGLALLESLEDRTLLSYTFSWDSGTNTATATGDSGVNTLVIEPVGSFLEYSVNGGPFSGNWGGDSVPAAPTTTVDITYSSGDGSTLQLGDSSGPASKLAATFNLTIPSNTSDTLTVDDSTGSILASTPPYTINSGSPTNTVTGPGFTINEPSGANQGGIFLNGSNENNNIYDVTSTWSTEPVTILAGASIDNEINLGSSPGTPSSSTLSGITSLVTVKDLPGLATVNLLDAGDTTSADAVFGSDTVSGLGFGSGGSLSYDGGEAGGIIGLKVDGGTNGASGITYNVNNTTDGTTTTINGGANANTYLLSNDGETGGLSNLPGPVVINGGGAGDTLAVDDYNSSANDNYTVSSTSITSTGTFGGLTYGGLGTGGSLTFHSSGGANVIDVNSTADDITTNVYGDAGVDTINVNGTGTGGTLWILSGDYTADASTINVIANSEPVNIESFANLPTVTTVNIGSTGGPGTMAGIQGAISVVNTPSFTDLSFHDENDTSGQTWTLDNDDTSPTGGTVAVTGSATTTYNPNDLTQLNVNGGSGGNAFIVNDTSINYPTTLNTGTGDDTVNVYDTQANTLNIHGQDGSDSVTLGANPTAPGMAYLNGIINVDNTLGYTALTLDDSLNTSSSTATLDNDGTTGTVTGLGSDLTINYADDGTQTLTVNGSNAGGNTFNVDNTFTNAPHVVPTVTTINKGTGGNNTVNVYGTAIDSALDLTGGAGDGTDVVNIVPGSVLGVVNVDEVAGSTSLVLNLTNDGKSHDFTLSSNGTTSTLHDGEGNVPDVTYTTSALNSFTIDTDPTFAQTLNVDFGEGGNPIPVSATGAGLIFNADGDGTNTGTPLGSHLLNIYGELTSGPFASEVHNANEQSGETFSPSQYGNIVWTDASGPVVRPDAPPPAAIVTTLNYSGLQPITDTSPAVNYTFNDYGYPDQSFSATTGPIVSSYQTIEFASTPTPTSPLNFEKTDIANKNFVTFVTPPPIPSFPGTGVIGTVNIPTPSVGLLSLTFNTTTGGDNNVSFLNTPPGVVTSLNGGADEDVTNVTGLGVAAGTVLFLNGGAANNTLNYDAGGEDPTILPGLNPGEFLISIPGAGVVDAINYQYINFTNLAPVVITPGPAMTINTVAGFQDVDQIVGTFTASIPTEALAFINGFSASDFTASINWGDPSPNPSAGTITQDASNPSIYYITGTHTFKSNGTYTVANTVYFAGGTLSGSYDGVAFTGTFAPAGPTPGISATANVTSGPIAVSAFPIVGTEGIAIPAAAIATFIDSSGASPVGDYSATIDIYNMVGSLIVSVPAASITQNGSSAQFTVNAPSFTLPEAGTYQVVVAVTSTSGTSPITVSGASTAFIADAALTPGSPAPKTGNTGVTLSSTTVGSFTDANPVATITDFIATIDWGDGSPFSTGTISQPGGPGTLFDVSGNHTYAKAGVYTVTTIVVDDDGQKTTLTNTFTITDLAVTGSTQNFTATEGIDTGLFVLATFEDPNTLATVADVQATLAIGGWGDGKPTTAGTFLTVQQIGVDFTNDEPIFEVLGRHTYADETPPGTPDPLTVIITTRGGVSTTLTSPPGGGVTVLDAGLTTSNGATITGVEGNSTGFSILGSFIDANQGSTVADFTTAPGYVEVNWGDGSAPQTLTSSNLNAFGSPNGVFWAVEAPHTYAEAGTYSYSVFVQDDGGSAIAWQGTALIKDAPLTQSGSQPTVSTTEAAIFPVPVFAPPAFHGPVASFTDGNPLAPLSDFTATIDWGDGTPNTTGAVSQPGGVGTAFIVSGSHTYADSGVNGGSGTYAIQVFVQDSDGSRLTVSNTATVADRAIPLTGILNPASDSGVSHTDDITNVTQPNFYGTSEPFSHVYLYANGTTVGQTQAGSDGSWSITSNYLSDGAYKITAMAIDQFGETTTPSPVTITPNLVIDTVGPKVTGVYFNRVYGQIDVTYQDFGGVANAGVGLVQTTIIDASNYRLVKAHQTKPYLLTAVNVTPGTNVGAQTAVLFINGGAYLRGGKYVFTIYSGSSKISGVQDIAGNALDGEYYGYLPSGNNVRGSDFVATLNAIHEKTYAPGSVIGPASPVQPPGTKVGGGVTIIKPVGPGYSPNARLAARLAARQSVRQEAKVTSVHKLTLASKHTVEHQVKLTSTDRNLLRFLGL